MLRLFFAFCISIFVSAAAHAATAQPGIGWVPTWDQALSEAKATNKPILLVAAAPQCGGVPGVW